jgi:hypothetical protein
LILERLQVIQQFRNKELLLVLKQIKVGSGVCAGKFPTRQDLAIVRYEREVILYFDR